MSDTFCPLAWTSLGMNTHGRIRICGYSKRSPNRPSLNSKRNPNSPSLNNVSIQESWNSSYYRQVRLDMLAGRKNSNCERCYVVESLGGKSKRHKSCQSQNLTKEDARKMTDNEGYVNCSPRQIDVRVGNICNLKCIHCWTGNSSKWYEDKLLLDKYENTQNIPMDNQWISNKGDVWKYIQTHIQDIKELSFLGGEPFASRSHNQLLDWLIENDYTHLSFHYVTNGTLLTKDIIKKLEKMKSVRLHVSMDGIQERAEFLRYPSNWKKLERNLLDLQYADFKARFQWTAYNTNIFRLPETYQYCSQKFPNMDFLLCDFVTQPVHMSIQNLPSFFKEQITEKLEAFKPLDSTVYLNFMNTRQLWDEQGSILYNYLEDLDRARQTNWRKILPEIADLWKQ